MYVTWQYAPFSDSVDSAIDEWDIWYVFLEPGEQFDFSLTGFSGNLDLFLFTPETTDLGASYPGYAHSTNVGSGVAERIQGSISTEGYWMVGVRSLAAAGEQVYTLDGMFAAPDDNAAGAPVITPADRDNPGLGTMHYFDAWSEWDDVYRVWLNTGDTIYASTVVSNTAGHSAGFSPTVALYAPEATDVFTDTPLSQGAYGYTAQYPGYYFLDLFGGDSGDEYGWASLYCSVERVPLTSVWRCYNMKNGTHFYTPSAEEAGMARMKYPSIYYVEGVAYSLNPAANPQSLYRFYNNRTGSHFYTASDEEAAVVMARWGNIFSFDGRTYPVSPTPGTAQQNKAPVYRFYNKTNGSHFYTASAEERDMVRARWSNIYEFEGPAFWIGL
jgi:hypothetical protein